MNPIGRRVRAAVNPMSTAFAGWWCHSAMRHTLTGHGPTARQWRLIRRETIIRRRTIPASDFTPTAAGHAPSAGQMRARAAAIDELLRQDQ